MDLACPAEAAQEPFPPGPAGVVHKGGAPPELVKTTAPAKAPIVRGFSERAIASSSDSLMDLGYPTDAALGYNSPGFIGDVDKGGTSPGLAKVQLAGRISGIAAAPIRGNSSGDIYKGGTSPCNPTKNVYKLATSSCSYASKVQLAGGGLGCSLTFPSYPSMSHDHPVTTSQGGTSLGPVKCIKVKEVPGVSLAPP